MTCRDVGRGNPECQARNHFHAFFLCFKPKDMATHEPPHIGHLIQEELARQGRTVTWLAKQLRCSRQNVYGIFANQWIYTDTLLRISEFLDFDFFKVYSGHLQKKKNDK